MPLSKESALESARMILQDHRPLEQTRLNRIRSALAPEWASSSVMLPVGATNMMYSLAAKSRTNYLPLILRVLTQTLIVDGYRRLRAESDDPAWQDWQRNGLDSRQFGIHKAALAYGISYMKVLPGDTGPFMRGVSPRAATALYQNPLEDEYPMLVLQQEADDAWVLYDEAAAYRFIDPVAANTPQQPGQPRLEPSGTLEYLQTDIHEVGVCPFVAYRDELDLDGDTMGIIEPLLPIQERVDETIFGMLIAQYYAAFKQRYIIGWVPKSEADLLKASAGHVWTFEDHPEDVKVGEFTETSPAGYLESKESGVVDMAVISQVPPQQIAARGGVSNLSAEALAALEAGKDRRVRSIETELGESHEQSLRLAAFIRGEGDLVNNEAQVTWSDETARSLAQTVDALGKMVTMLGVPAEATWEKIPGVTDTDITNWKAAALRTRTTNPIAALADTLDRQAGNLPPTAGGAAAGV